MNKYSVNPENEEKTSHPIRKALCIIAIVLIAGCFLFGDRIAAAIAAENEAKQPIGATTDADVGDIDHPAGDVFECDLAFLDMDHANVAMPKPQPSTPASPSYHAGQKLYADTEYIIQFDFPDMLLAEIENDHHDFEIVAKYDFKVERDSRFHAEIKLYNKTSGNLYVATADISAADDLCVKHSFGAGTNYICDYPEFADDHFAFSLYTSALPDAGPKTTTESSFGRFSINYTIAGRFATPNPGGDHDHTEKLTPPEN